jgi:hypothetical protein
LLTGRIVGRQVDRRSRERKYLIRVEALMTQGTSSLW